MRLKQETAGVQTGSSIHTPQGLQSNMQVFFMVPSSVAAAFLFGDVVFCYPPRGLNMLHLKVGRHPLVRRVRTWKGSHFEGFVSVKPLVDTEAKMLLQQTPFLWLH